MAATFTGGRYRVLNASGAPVNNAKIHTYEAGTLTARTTYSNRAGTVANANPVRTDSSGVCTIYLQPGVTRFIVTDADDVALPDGDCEVSAIADSTDLAASTGSSLIGFLQAGTGAVARTAQSKARDLIHALDFDADNSGDDTAKLKAAFDYAIPLGRTVTLKGDYTVSGPISDTAQIAAGSLFIHCDGPVTITVDAGATAFTKLLNCVTTAINNVSITGGRLTLNLNNKCSNGLYARHYGGDGGSVSLGMLTVNDAKENDSGATAENNGVFIYGRYESVVMWAPIIDGVDRTNTSAGACKGISVTDIVGPCVIYGPTVARVLCTGSTADADGIAVFGRQLNGTYGHRAGSLHIIGGTITDCEGRSIKTQISDSLIEGVSIYRKNVVAFATADIDHQVGGTHAIVEPKFTYEKASGVTPFAAEFYPISLQQRCTDRPNRMRVLGGVIRTEAALARLCYVTVGATSLGGEVEITDMEFLPIGALSTTIFTSAVLEFHAGQVQAATSTHITLKGNRGNLSGCRLLGYTDASAANTSKLSFDLIDNENTGADHASSECFGELGGTIITQVGAFKLRGNAGFNDYLGAWVFDYLTLKAGCSFAYDRATSTASNGPVLTGTYPRVEALGNVGVNTRHVRVMEDTGAALKVHYRTDSTWRNV